MHLCNFKPSQLPLWCWEGCVKHENHVFSIGTCSLKMLSTTASRSSPPRFSGSPTMSTHSHFVYCSCSANLRSICSRVKVISTPEITLPFLSWFSLCFISLASYFSSYLTIFTLLTFLPFLPSYLNQFFIFFFLLPMVFSMVSSFLLSVVSHGERETLSEIRSEYWNPKGRQTVKRISNKFAVCKKVEDLPYSSLTDSDFPEFRVVGGQVYTKVHHKSKHMTKNYICKWTYATSKVIYSDILAYQ